MAEEPEGTAVLPVVFDTDVLVWYFRGSDAARRFLARIRHSSRAVSSLTVMEVVQGCRNRAEIGVVKAFVLDSIPLILHPDEAAYHRAIALLEEHARGHGLRVVDALIAATALERGASLATANVKHYRVIRGLELLPFKPGAPG